MLRAQFMPPKPRKFIDTNRYKRLVELSNDLIWSTDTAGLFTFVNDAAALRIYGYTAEEMVGRRFTEFSTPEQCVKDEEVIKGLMRGGRITGYRTIHARKDGTPIHLNANAMAEVSPAGEIIGATGTATDVSSMVRYAAELERSEERYRLLFENATEPIGVAQDGRIVFFNKAVIAATGYGADEIKEALRGSHPPRRSRSRDRAPPAAPQG